MNVRLRVRQAFLATSLCAALAVAMPASAGAISVEASPSLELELGTCAPSSFEKASVVTEEDGTRTLVVSGLAPYSNTVVTLVPVTYIQQPDFWLIQVIGCQEGIGAAVLTPFTATLDVTALTGTEGIIVVGSNNAVTIPNEVAVPAGQ